MGYSTQPWRSSKIGLLEFVDVSGRMMENFLLPGDESQSDREYLEVNLAHAGLGGRQAAEARQLLDAVDFARDKRSSIEMGDLVEIQRRVVGRSSEGLPWLVSWLVRWAFPDFRSNEARDELRDAILPKLNARLAQSQDPLERVKAAAWFSKCLTSLRPFVDGSARVGEVVVSIILKDWAPFPLRIHDRGWLREQSIPRDGIGEEELAALILQRALARAKRDGGEA
ncbi:hypothetical protein SELMODRAFT_427875 [Selaginella moellendorffii]|uniref:Fido domain-containing protein n=1 Tax=Selaginella moellendorffii TaxID=88036 RepID=D8T0Z9_SELML|nr:hypothetical protein SELMODRAFT_427875 [Selaginella moellendorffii]